MTEKNVSEGTENPLEQGNRELPRGRVNKPLK